MDIGHNSPIFIRVFEVNKPKRDDFDQREGTDQCSGVNLWGIMGTLRGGLIETN